MADAAPHGFAAFAFEPEAQEDSVVREPLDGGLREVAEDAWRDSVTEVVGVVVCEEGGGDGEPFF